MLTARGWARIDEVLRRYAPAAFDSLAGPASDESLRELEHAFCDTVPTDLVESLRIHNGQTGAYMTCPFINSQWLLSTTEIRTQWLMRNQLNEPFDIEWWAPHYLPFTDSEGDALCVDTRVQGGPVTCHVHDGGMLEAPLAPSLGVWLDRLATALEGGRFRSEHSGLWLTQPDALALIYGP